VKKYILIIYLLCAFSGTAQTPSPSGSSRVDALVVVSSNDAFVATITEVFRSGMPKQTLLDHFKAQKLRTKDFGRNGLVIVDLAIPMFEQLQENTRLLKVLKTALNDNYVLRLSDLKEEDRETVKKHFAASDVFSEKSVMKPEETVMGLDVAIAFTIRGPSGEKRMDLSYPRDLYGERDNLLLAQPRRKYQATQREIEERLTAGKRKYLEDNRMCIHLVRRFGHSIAQCTTAVADFLEELEADWRKNETEAGKELLSRFPLTWSKADAGFQPTGETNFDSLPEDIRKRLEQRFVDSWRAKGFQGEDEARQFLLNSGSITMGTRLSTIFGTKKGSPPYTPNLFYVHVLGVIP